MTSSSISYSSHPSANHSFTHYTFFYASIHIFSFISQPLIHPLHLYRSFHLSIYSSITSQSMTPHYIFFQSSVLSFISQAFLYSPHFPPFPNPLNNEPTRTSHLHIHSTFHSSTLPSISQELIYPLHLHPSFHPLIYQPTTDAHSHIHARPVLSYISPPITQSLHLRPTFHPLMHSFTS